MQKRTTIAGLGVLAVALWVAGLAIGHAVPSKLASHPTDQQILAWVQSNTNAVVMGGWLFMVGCIAFVAFVVLLRLHVPDGPLSTLLYSGAIIGAVGGLLTQGDFVTGIDKSDVSPAAAAAFHHMGDLGFCGVELALVLVLGATAGLALSARALPTWYGWLCGILAVAALIGPIGWVVVIFGTPLYTLVTPWLVGRPARRTAPAAATAAA